MGKISLEDPGLNSLGITICLWLLNRKRGCISISFMSFFFLHVSYFPTMGTDVYILNLQAEIFLPVEKLKLFIKVTIFSNEEYTCLRAPISENVYETFWVL